MDPSLFKSSWLAPSRTAACAIAWILAAEMPPKAKSSSKSLARWLPGALPEDDAEGPCWASCQPIFCLCPPCTPDAALPLLGGMASEQGLKTKRGGKQACSSKDGNGTTLVKALPQGQLLRCKVQSCHMQVQASVQNAMVQNEMEDPTGADMCRMQNVQSASVLAAECKCAKQNKCADVQNAVCRCAECKCADVQNEECKGAIVHASTTTHTPQTTQSDPNYIELPNTQTKDESRCFAMLVVMVMMVCEAMAMAMVAAMVVSVGYGAMVELMEWARACLLYTSDAADDM
eukprot:15460722-Alexandrium_andersonii.AAC.1